MTQKAKENHRTYQLRIGGFDGLFRTVVLLTDK